MNGVITAAKQDESENGKPTIAGKVMQRWLVSIQNGEETYETNVLRLSDSADPTNETAETYEDRNGKTRWRIQKKEGSFSGGGKSKSPEEQKRIVRQHSQEMAIRTLALMPGSGTLEPDKLREAVKRWTDWYEADVG